jgi:hypothetical protein
VVYNLPALLITIHIRVYQAKRAHHLGWLRLPISTVLQIKFAAHRRSEGSSLVSI